jgi:uncharacterized protein (DUF2147 family)
MLLFAAATVAGDEIPPVEGTWLSGDGDGWIDIRIDGDGLSGVISGSPDPDPERPDKDEKNPDPALRDRPLIGLDLFSGFRYAGEGRWKGGRIYDPNSGKTYRCVVTLVDVDTLEVRGYVGVPMLGRTETWKRLKD